MSTIYPSDLTDAEWTCVQGYLPVLSTCGRPRTHPLRRILDAIFYEVRTGCPWRYLPANFPSWQTVFYHFRRFRLQGRWHLLYTAVHRAEREREREPCPQGFQVQPRRWVIECSFAWLSRNRRLARDYERRVQTSEALIELAMTHLLLRRLGR